MNKLELEHVIEKHRKWLYSEDGGVRADLSSADLSSANLSSATGELKYLKSIFIDKYPITYTSDVLQIGCERHNISEWWEFDDDRIIKMDAGALKLWKKWGTMIKNIIEMSPAEPTKTGENNV